MEKKQSTLFSFFKPGSHPLISTAEGKENQSRSTTANSSPKCKTEIPVVHKSVELDRGSGPKSTQHAKKRKVSVSSSSSCSSSDSSSYSSSESSGASSLSGNGNLIRSTKMSTNERKKQRKSLAAEEEEQPYTPSIDVESLYSFGNAFDKDEKRRDFQVEQRDEPTEPVLSVEEIDKLCKDVPPYVAMFTRFYYELNSRFEFPSWYNPRNLKDKQRRAPTDPDYDVTTLLVPRKNGKVAEDGHSTPMLQQYWDIKEDHFSDIILFKVGKFYELFYIDAAIAQQVCQLKWMGHDRRAHVGFPETSLQHHASLLIEQGYTVCVVEQTETVTEANERSANAGRKSTGALVERKICEVFTTGTLIHEDMLNGRNTHYLCGISGASLDHIALVIVDCATGQFQLGTVHSTSSLKTILYSFQPREIVFDPKSTGSELMKLLNASKESLGVVITRWNMTENKQATLPDRLTTSELWAEVESNKDLHLVVSGVVSYLRHLLLDEQVVQCGDWRKLVSSTTGSSMVMDSTVLSQLEILKDSEQSDKGSLFKFIDRTSTPFGSRLLQRWVCAPLANPESINERLDSVEWLVARQSIRKKFEEKLKQLPDLERRLQRICAMALQQQRNAVYFGEVENKRIGVFLSFLASIEAAISSLEWLSNELNGDAKQVLLQELTSHAGTADEIKLLCQNLKGMIESKKDGSFGPRKGAFDDYDKVLDELKSLDTEFKDELSRVKSEIGIKSSGEAIYVSIKFKNEIEVPAEYESKVKRIDGEITSCKKGYIRFQTDRVKELVEKSNELEQQLKDLLYPFMARLFGVVNEKKFLLGKLIQRVAELDCLLALSKVSSQGKTWTRPVFGSDQEGRVTISMADSRHPIQEHLMQLEREFVPNTVELGEKESILLVTGANMGGKSTILRQVCVNVILAQMGCFVPCSSCTISAPVDRIFTRIGASDNILEGKSTFLTELEETAVMLKEATPRSLLVIDELGRGTSTYDGVAIAGATLSAIAKIGCVCLFATHYHKLCEEVNPAVGLYHMECVTKPDGTIDLTHKFKAGLYPHSQAMHVARLAGIPEPILTEADAVSKQFLISMS